MVPNYVNNRVLEYAALDRNITPAQFRILFFLAMRQGTGEGCTISLRRIWGATGLSESAVLSGIKRLDRTGYLLASRWDGTGRCSATCYSAQYPPVLTRAVHAPENQK